ncbi:class I SAM-dependent methyltransferase [Synechococcus elongatus]|nr:class I SAM-dependent methyltransferase [Synechococcus elongatus]AJD58058.1 membrane protein [Synechococcus elongatus UTEX 2973]MBD2588527.1 class I SAM-dependent methyltransferase [Synechococcus elongatus FACHB-242]MBD2689595.1 class I SAM-dependent methyltransferase [Synechococcus elongatus FACHB-1061]MBD2707986.1 class I SAM-dependent methyltransferase [Synechococcus elongatus PCC 7942 = FACHB-805]UOW71223.1 Ubiquinone/menaquinone biosynthesis C-methylase UbiE [Synechococcus elongatus PC
MENHSTPVQEEYTILASSYDRRWDFYIHATIQETLKRITISSQASVLDLGCGTGSLLQQLAAQYPTVKLSGLDISAAMLAIARQKLPDSVKLQTGEANELPFPEHHFDLVISTSVFHYFQNPEKVLQEITRVLKPQGCLILTDWCRNYLMINLLDRWLHWVDKAHVRAYSIDDLQKILIESNFKLLSIDQYRINWFWGLMTIQAARGDIAA